MTQIPYWANWLARDKDGKLCDYEKEPFELHREEVWISESGDCLLIEETDDRYAHIQWEDEEPTRVKQKETTMNQDRITAAMAHGYEEPPVMKALTKEEHTALHTYENGAITKPTHYLDKHGKDLYQKWYEEHDLPIFRAIMRAIAERYTSRYEKKNGIEDLDKGIYTLQRLKEYEEVHNEP